MFEKWETITFVLLSLPKYLYRFVEQPE